MPHRIRQQYPLLLKPQLHTEQRDFLWVFAEPLARWRHEQPSSAQRRELDRLEGQLERLRAVLTDILELAKELKQGTIGSAHETDEIVR